MSGSARNAPFDSVKASQAGVAGPTAPATCDLPELQNLLAPYPLDEFLSSIWGQTFLHVPGCASKFVQYCGWSHVNRTLEHQRFDMPRLRFEHEDKGRKDLTAIRHVPSSAGGYIPRLDANKVTQLLREGATLVLDAAEEAIPPLRELTMNLEAEIGHRLRVNLYASWGSTPGFGLHWDTHDVFILQLEGRKRWKVWSPTRNHPIEKGAEERPNRPPDWDVTLEAGGLLYVPRGFWHDVVGLDCPTLHGTLGSSNGTGMDLITWFATESGAIEEFRQDVPLFGSDERRREHSRRLRALFLDLWNDDAVDRFLRYRRSSMETRPHFSFPHGVAASQPLPAGDFWVQHCGSAPQIVPLERGKIMLRTGNQTATFSMKARSVLERLLLRRPIRLSELIEVSPTEFTDTSARNFIVQLLALGLVRVWEAEGLS